MTVLELIQALQRAVIVDELDEDSEVLDLYLNPAHLTINREQRHAVIEWTE